MVNLSSKIAITVSEHYPCCHHQAAMHNPNVSAEAKEHSRQVVEDIQGSGVVHEDSATEPSSRSYDDGKEENRVLGGYKATLKSQCFLPFDRRDGGWLTPRLGPYLQTPTSVMRQSREPNRYWKTTTPCNLDSVWYTPGKGEK
jgi:hypothetical protein